MLWLQLGQGGGGGGSNWVQLIGLLIVFGFSALSWLIRTLQTQAAKKREKDELERRKLEALRTGRPIPEAQAADPDSEARAQAARRRAQMEELRRRAQERSRAQNVPPTRPTPVEIRPGPVLTIPGSSGTTVPQRRTPTPRQGPRQQPKQERKRQQAEERPTRQRVAEPERPSRRIAPLEPAQTPQAAPAPTLERPAAAALAAVNTPKTAAEWRRALVLSELLGPPVALRDPAGSGEAAPPWPAGGPPGGAR